MFDLIDNLIATVAVVLVLSLIVQSIQQIMKQLFNMKSKFMERELFAMFAHVGYKRSIIPVKFQFSKLAARLPDVKDLVGKISGRMGGVGYDDLSILESLKKEDFLKIVGDLVDTGELEVKDRNGLTPDEKNRLIEQIDFLQKARSDIEQWYDTTLKSFQDHYERRMKMWAFGMSALVVIWLNANIFDIYKEFASNPAVRAATVKMGERLVEAKADTLVTRDTLGGAVKTIKSSTPPIDTIRVELAKIKSLMDSSSFNLMRWDRAQAFPRDVACVCEYFGWIWNVLSHNFFGWLGMTLLVGLGAPFWYDLLKTLMGVKDKLRGQSGSVGANGSTVASGAPPAANPAGPPAHG